MIKILSLGAGVQSTALLLMSCRGDLPRLDGAIFSDTQYEPKAVYEHLDWLVAEAARHGIPVFRVSAGDLRQDAIEFRRDGKSADGKRHASIPFFLKNPGGSDGKLPRQCTGTYKIDTVERAIRTEFLGLAKGYHAPKEPVVEQWFGISSDEGRRVSYPGVYARARPKGVDLLGSPLPGIKVWKPLKWKVHHYPFLGLTTTPDRKSRDVESGPRMDRDEIKVWLKTHYPDREVPRSACIGCPFRSNEEWRIMKEEDPESWADAVDFDRQIRLAEAARQKKRGMLVGIPFVHVQRVPLDQADLGSSGHQGPTGCGTLFDCATTGCESGMCGT